jgi:hypothetical protein
VIRASLRSGNAVPIVLAGIGFALVLSLVFWPVVSGKRSFFHHDLRYEHFPIWEATQSALLSGESPFWLKGMFCGHPLLFTQEAPLFYPPTTPLLLTGAPVHRLADLFSLFHFWLAGFAAFLLLRDLGTDFSSSLFGGVGWMLSTRLVHSAIWPNAVAASALLPFLLLGVLRIGRGQRRSGLLWTSISGGLLLLASRPQLVLGAAPLVGAVALVAIARAAHKAAALRDLGLAAVLALALGAPAVLPSAVLYPETARGGGLTRQERDPHPLMGDLDQVFLPVDRPWRWPETAAYPGLLVGLFFIVGIAIAARPDPAFPRAVFAALAAGGSIGLLFALGESGPYGLVADIPFLRGFRLPARYLASWALALPLASSLALGRALGRSRHRDRVGSLFAAVLCLDLGIHARKVAPSAPAEMHAIPPRIVRVLEQSLSRDETGFTARVWSTASPIPFWFYDDEGKLALAELDSVNGALGMRWGLESANGEGVPLARIDRLLKTNSLEAARLMGVGALVSSDLPAPRDPRSPPPPLIVRKLTGIVPRAVIASEAVVVAESQAVGAALAPARDPRRTVILEEGDPLRASSPPGKSFGTVTLLSETVSKIDLLASLPGSGVLVLHNSFERGWRSTIDGAPARVVRADAAFLGVRLSAGTHRVRFGYHPRGLKEGLGLAAAGLLGLVLAATKLPPVSA